LATLLFYDQARCYYTTIGRLVSQDPKRFTAGERNLHRYVGNEPTERIDPSGEFGTRLSILVGAFAGAGLALGYEGWQWFWSSGQDPIQIGNIIGGALGGALFGAVGPAVFPRLNPTTGAIVTGVIERGGSLLIIGNVGTITGVGIGAAQTGLGFGPNTDAYYPDPAESIELMQSAHGSE
jgi:hypothetical protein